MDDQVKRMRMRMRLRYAGSCRDCGQPVAAGEWAIYHRVSKNVQCLSCAEAPAEPVSAHDEVTTAIPIPPTMPVSPPMPVVSELVTTGIAGASARREHERRVAKREDRIRKAHPKLGGFILAVSDEPQSTRAWARGARGEELLAKRLDGLVDRGVLLLHDRCIPGTKGNIDHIAVSQAGVFVIDAKRYQGRPQLRIQGGLLRPRTETLLVGRRDCTKLVAGIQKQVDLVRAAISTAEFSDVPVRGMLCFIEADWPIIGGSFTTAGIDVLWPRKANEKITAAGSLASEIVAALHGHLAGRFPAA
jgi:hypothetical protein